MAIDFDQLRKDMEDGTDGPLRQDAWERLILSLPDLGRIALAAEKYRKAVLKAKAETEIGGRASVYASHERGKARAELFALLTGEDVGG